MLHTYTVLGWADGAQYEVITALQRGATVDHVLETMALAFIHAGPRGMSQVASLCSSFLKKWSGKIEFATDWPETWRPDPDAFHSGLDFQTLSLTTQEIERVTEWYTRNHGEVPSHVAFLAKWNPEGLKSLRHRYESAIVTLPKQVVPLLMLNTAAVQGNTGMMRRAAHQARYYGVLRSQALEVLTRAIAYTGDATTNLVADAIGPLFDSWPDQAVQSA
jgi:hypothetical protein